MPRPPLHRLHVIAVLAIAVVLSSCTGGDGASGTPPPGTPDSSGSDGGPTTDAPSDADGQPSPTPTPDPDIAEGPAPSNGNESFSLRADEVRRSGSALSIDLTLALAETQRTLFRPDEDIVVTTNTGLELPIAEGPERTLQTQSRATLTVDVPLPDETVRDVRVELKAVEVTIPIPQDDGRTTWRPAALRQAGLQPAVLRDDTALSLVPATIRSRGLVTEVTYTAIVQNTGYDTGVCEPTISECRLEDADGRTYPMLGSGPDALGFGQRATGTFRFLGEVPPDQTDLRMFLDGNGCVVCGDPTFELEVTLPTAEDSPARAVASSWLPEPTTPDATIDDADSGASLLIERVAFLSDHVQVRVHATGGTDDLDLYGSDAGLRDDTGYVHELLFPAEAELVVPADGELDATLVFGSPIAPGTRQLDLVLGRDQHLQASIEVPAAPGPSDDQAPTMSLRDLGDRDDLTDESTLPAPSVEGTEGRLATFDIVDLPTTTARGQGSIRSSIEGITTGGATTSSDVVDPDAAADAERSLEELGAQRTPDGLVVTLPETVLFAFDSAELAPTAADTIAAVAAVLAFYDSAEVGVEGHTDGRGERDYNQDLSVQRAQAVADALVADGISSGRLEVVGFGMDHPIAPNTTADGEDDPDGRARNRRVEIVLRQE